MLASWRGREEKETRSPDGQGPKGRKAACGKAGSAGASAGGEALKAEADGPKPLRTVALVKPEAKHNFAKILKYVRRGGFEIVCAKMITPTQVRCGECVRG